MDNLFNFEELKSALNEFNTVAETSAEKMSSDMPEEMKAAQKRYEEYIVKHKDDK